MKFKKLFLSLKNGKPVIFYRQGADESSTVEVTYNNDTFILFSYVFEGEEVRDDLNFVQEFKEEFTTNFSDFNALIADLEHRFPGINLNI
jgi:hypothetical protein